MNMTREHKEWLAGLVTAYGVYGVLVGLSDICIDKASVTTSPGNREVLERDADTINDCLDSITHRVTKTLARFELVDLGLHTTTEFLGFESMKTPEWPQFAFGIGYRGQKALNDCIRKMLRHGYDEDCLHIRIQSQYRDLVDKLRLEPVAPTGQYYCVGIRWDETKP